MQPDTRYARLGEDRIAYQVIGDGPTDLLFVAGMSGHVDLRWEEPFQASFLRDLASFSRLIIFDRRGTGASDPFPYEPTTPWEAWADDVRAVLDTVGSERAAILAQLDAGPMAILFAASAPERTQALVLANTAARFVAGVDYAATPPDVADELVRQLEENWPSPVLAQIAYPSQAGNESFLRWFQKYLRASASPREYLSYARLMQQMDVREILPSVQAPTLVLHRENAQMLSPDLGRYLADHIPDARFVTIPGADLGLWTESPEAILRHVEEFVTGVTGAPSTDRVLATVMFTDIVGSTDLAARMGDRRWKDVLGAHDDVVRGYVSRYQGTVVKVAGDGVLATFDGPGRSIRCAVGMAQALGGLGLELRTALHTGEVELRDDGDVAGIGVHIAARVRDAAAPGEIVVTRTVRDLVAGSPFDFEDRGVHHLKGVPEDWQLYALRAG